jgi:hypothetical protein|tara:strand:+ start:557 stop:1303 length:747 start_codon:yes stop_codon:yes gene_type:complete
MSSTKELEKNWVIKDRVYKLNSDRVPIVKIIKSRNLYWFDEGLGYEREIKLTSNQKTPFVDEFKGDARLDNIIFRDGFISVPKNKQVMQKILSLYHPGKDNRYIEVDEVKIAENDLDYLEMEISALNSAKGMDVDQAEAVLRVELGSKVSSMSSKEIRRDVLLMARNNPEMFLELANDDNVNLRNIGIKATEANIIKLAADQRTFKWGSNGRKLMTVPFDENPYSALAAWFKTDEGIEVFQTIEKKLK